MIPTTVVLSPQNYAKAVTELAEKLGRPGLSHLQLAHHLNLAVTIQQENTDMIILKELTPNACPICHHPLIFPRETTERFENEPSNLIRCPMGHRYPGVLKIYYLDLLHPPENTETEKPIKTCPACNGKNLHYLGPKTLFCLDCDWDTGMEPRFSK